MPKGGLEPPHPCEYMDLNHARLPIPPLRHGVLKRRPAKELKHLPRDSSFTNPAGDVNASPLRRLVGWLGESLAQGRRLEPDEDKAHIKVEDR